MHHLWKMAALWGAGVLAAQAQSVTLPWPEFEALYRLRLDQEQPERSAEAAPAEVVLESSAIVLHVHRGHARAEFSVSGRRLAGRPHPVELLSLPAVLEAGARLEGAVLLVRDTLHVLPHAEAFRLAFSILLPIEADGPHQAVTVPLPPALSRVLTVRFDEGLEAIDAPGLPGTEPGTFHPLGDSAQVRFADATVQGGRATIEVDVLTRISLEQQKAMLRVHFDPRETGAGPLAVHIPEGTRYVGGSLRPSAVTQTRPGLLDIRVGREPGPFELAFLLDAAPGEVPVAVHLPRIEGNTGRERALVVENPDDGRLELDGPGLVRDVPSSRLARGLRAAVGDTFHLAEGDEPLHIRLLRFEKVVSPEVVVDAVEVFITFAENGDRLTLVRLPVPVLPESRLRIQPGEGSRVWHCRVNGSERSVFAAGDGAWFVPLARDGVSKVEIAWIQPGKPLGLHGRVEADIPALGLAARQLHLTLGLPSRLELLSYEGQVQPVDSPRTGDLPREFEGRPHRFTRAFFEGPAIPLALHFREPVQP